MPIMFVGRAGKGAAGRKPATAARSIAIEPFDLTVGIKTATVKTTGLTHIGWSVFANTVPNYPWYAGGGDNVPVGANGTVALNVELFNPGDRLKVFASAASPLGAEARDFTVVAESGQAVAGAQAAGPAAIVSRMGFGMNQERFTVRDHSGVREAAYYQRYRNAGIRQVRFFIPVGFEGWQLYGNDGEVDLWLDGVAACLASGMPVVHLDLCDVIGVWQLDGAGVSRIDEYLGRTAARIAQRNWPKERFIIGAVNEYGGGTNGEWQPHRFRMNQILRDALPQHTIVEGPAYWKNTQALFDPNFKNGEFAGGVGVYNPWSDTNTIQDVHHYFGWDLAGMTWLAEQCQAWAAANNRQVYSGEWGFDDLFLGASDRVSIWIDRFNGQMGQSAIAKIRPTAWAVTDGNDWPVNNPGGNQFRPGMDTSIPAWCRSVDQLLGLA